jgi:hypothetical protein
MTTPSKEQLRENFEDSLPDLLKEHEQKLREEFEEKLGELEDEEEDEEA